MNESKSEDVMRVFECRKCEYATVCKSRSMVATLLREKDAEIERLTAQIEHCDACDRIGLTHTEHMYCIKQAKSEAIAEFAERLKSEVNGGQFASYKGLEIRNVIDQIAKEMKEGRG